MTGSAVVILALFGQLIPASARDSLPRPLPRINVESSSAREQTDRWLAMDKFWHFSASFVTVGATYHFGRDRISLSEPLSTGIATGGTITLGLTKEFYDLAGPGGRFSWRDLAADALGVCAGYFAFIHRY